MDGVARDPGSRPDARPRGQHFYDHWERAVAFPAEPRRSAHLSALLTWGTTLPLMPPLREPRSQRSHERVRAMLQPAKLLIRRGYCGRVEVQRRDYIGRTVEVLEADRQPRLRSER